MFVTLTFPHFLEADGQHATFRQDSGHHIGYAVSIECAIGVVAYVRIVAIAVRIEIEAEMRARIELAEFGYAALYRSNRRALDIGPGRQVLGTRSGVIPAY